MYCLGLIIDVDECALNTDNCTQLCTNLVGSFECSCFSGFTLDTDGSSCNGNALIAVGLGLGLVKDASYSSPKMLACSCCYRC